MIDAILHHSLQAMQHVDASLYPRGTCYLLKQARTHQVPSVFIIATNYASIYRQQNF